MAERPDAGAPQWTSERFEAWLEQTAKNEGRSKREILHRMMASFWVLTEFEDLVDDPSAPNLSNLEQTLERSLHEDADATAHSPADTTGPDTDHPTSDAPDAETVRGLIEGFATYLDDHGPTPAAPTQDATPTEPTADTNTPDPTASNLAQRTADLEDRQDDLEADHEALAERIDADMAKVEQILKRLTEKYQESGSTLDQLESTMSSVLEARRTEGRERDQLARLLQSAHAHGITEGTCADCDTQITLGLLTSPRCPHCSTLLVDARPGGWFKADTIVTADPRQQHSTGARRHQADSPQARQPPPQRQQSTANEDPETDLAAALDLTDSDDDTTAGEDSDQDSFEWTEW